jgi:hypothetical protein
MDSQYLLILSACKIDDPQEEEKICIISRQLDRLFVLLRLQRAYDSNDFADAMYEISTAIRDGNAGSISSAFEAKLLSILSENRSVTVSAPSNMLSLRALPDRICHCVLRDICLRGSMHFSRKK